MGRNDCRAAIAAFAAGDAARFHGLPAGCTAGDLDLESGAVDGFLGEPPEPRTIRFVKAASGVRVRAWFAGDRLVLVDAEDPPAPAGWQTYLRPLGEPETKLPYKWDMFTLADAEWLWPSRGIVIAVKANTGFILRAGIFVPGTLADYQRDARFISQYTEYDD